MAVGSALSVPIRTQLPGENYLQTFNAKFEVYRPTATRSYSLEGPDEIDYRERVLAGFEHSKGILVDLWA